MDKGAVDVDVGRGKRGLMERCCCQLMLIGRPWTGGVHMGGAVVGSGGGRRGWVVRGKESEQQDGVRCLDGTIWKSDSRSGKATTSQVERLQPG